MSKYDFKNIIRHLVTQGFFYQTSEIYGGLANAWDYGPLGAIMKFRLKSLWWSKYVEHHPLNFGIDTNIILNPHVWKASGHIKQFSDLMIDCKNCRQRFRADDLIAEEKLSLMNINEIDVNTMNVCCPNCKKQNWTNIRDFNLMFRTNYGVFNQEDDQVYLRPETSQGIYSQFKNLWRTVRQKLPFGVAQIGKSFRNEITPHNFLFRTREFEQMEIIFFHRPDESEKWMHYWRQEIINFLDLIGIDKKDYHFQNHTLAELAHYAQATIDVVYHFPFGDAELWGLSNRSNFDLQSHSEHAKIDCNVLDKDQKTKILPYTVEPSVGVDRLILAILCSAYTEELLPNNERRIALNLPWILTPYQLMITGLHNKFKPEVKTVYDQLLPLFRIYTDWTGSIGKRYRRADAIGVNYCLTFDYDSITDHQLTIRDRRTMQQSRVSIKDLAKYLQKISNHHVKNI